MKKIARALVLVLVAATCVSQRTRADEHGPTRPLIALGDAAAIERLQVLVDAPITRAASGSVPADLLLASPEAVVLVLDGARRSVARYRAEDSAPSIRQLSADGPPPSAFQLAFVAAEMLPLPRRQEPITTHAPPAAPAVALAVRAGASIANPFDGTAVYPAGTLGLALWRRPARFRAWLLAGELEGQFGASAHAGIDATHHLTLQRRSARLRLGAGHDFPGGLALVSLEGALQRTRAVVEPRSDNAAFTAHRIGLACGVRVELRVHLTGWLDASFSLTPSVAGNRSDYRYMGARIARERKLSGEASASLLVHFGQ